MARHTLTKLPLVELFHAPKLRFQLMLELYPGINMAKRVWYDNFILYQSQTVNCGFFVFFPGVKFGIFPLLSNIISIWWYTASAAGQPFVVAMRAKMSSKRMFAVGASVLIHFVTPVHCLKRSFNLFNEITRLKANLISFYTIFSYNFFLTHLGLIY